ncbi:hypothetical protein BGW39_010724 [Mortierella sp. 14UC]|nr:hypothetical protein BGW39_010724 [Mortierella sp. 14UC]
MSRPSSQGSQRHREPSQTRDSDSQSGYGDNNRTGANGPIQGGHQGRYRPQGDGLRAPEGAYPPRQSEQRHYPQHAPPPRHYQQQHQQQHQQQRQQLHQVPPYSHPLARQSEPPAPIRLVPGQTPPFPIQFMQYPNSTYSQRPKSHSDQRHQHYSPNHHSQYRQQQQQQQQDTFSENQFPVHPLNRFKVKCVPFRQPLEIGSFSYDEQRRFIMDDSQLKYYFPPDLTKPNNLSVNYDKYISRDLMVDEHIDALLDALICIRDREQQQEGQEQNAAGTTQANFICYRGLLTKIMCTPYARNEPWEMGATLYNGSIYIEEHVSAEKRENAAGHNDRHKLMSYWGYRFETICNISKPVSELRRVRKATLKRGAPTQLSSGQVGSDSPQSKISKLEAAEVNDSSDSQKRVEDLDTDSSNAAVQEEDEEEDIDDLTTMTDQIDPEDPELTGRLDGIVDTNLQYCTVARTKIGNNSIIMGAEVDCTSEPKEAPPHNPLSNYIELKTSRIISNAREKNSFERHKLLKFWAQSFLPGIPTIIVGFRDDDGNVVTVETFKTMEIPRLDTTICINFLDAVLNFLRKQIKVDNPRASYTIRWGPPYKAIEVEYNGERTSSFLTDRFLKSQNKS